jgi:glutaredoxin
MRLRIGRLRRFVPVALLALAGWTGMQLLERVGSERLGREVSAAARPGDIVMLSSETCPYCKQARAWFDAHQVPFGECFIERDAACAAAYRALQSPGTPTLVVRGQRQVGFSPERVALALRQG